MKHATINKKKVKGKFMQRLVVDVDESCYRFIIESQNALAKVLL
jgi:hypothetical protein